MKQALTLLNPERYFIAFILFISYVGIGFIHIQQAHLSLGHLAVIWLPAGIGLLMALEIGPAAFILIFFASLTLNAPTYYYINTPSNAYPLITSLSVGIGTALIDVWQAHIATKAWQYFVTKHDRSPLQNPTDLPYFWGKICFIPALFSMTLTHILLSLASIISTQDWRENIQQMLMLIMGDTAGLFIIAPIYASCKSNVFKYRIRPAIPYFIALILIVTLGFLLYSYLLMLILPILLLIAIRFRLAGTSVALLIVFTFLMTGTTHHLGPFFSPNNPPLSFLNLQLFLFSIGLTLHYLALLQELLSHSHLQLETEVTLRTEALAAANQRLEELVTTDELTGVANRREWQRRCDEAIIYARRYQQPLSILLIDIDHFKNVNDQHGHLAGDVTLKELCRVCTAELRASDSFARWGGEEFVLLLPGTTQAEAILAGNKLRIAVENQALVEYHGHKIRITISVGVAMLEDNDSSLDHLLNRADQAMYAAKAAGRNQVQCAISSSTFNQ
jgi:diguanylate cyclase (GGDEF)-like protein